MMLVDKLLGVQLDWAVAKAAGKLIEGEPHPSRHVVMTQGGPHQKWYMLCVSAPDLQRFSPSTNATQAVELMEQARIASLPQGVAGTKHSWLAHTTGVHCYGPTMIVAGMRAYVKHKVGNVIELPEELLYE